MRTDAEWEQVLKAADDLVAKGYSLEVPRWGVRDHLRKLLREAAGEQNGPAYDHLTFALDRWNQKA